MTFTILVGIVTLFLILAGSMHLFDAAGTDPEPSGNWGFFEYREWRNRTVTPHEQRWQTNLVQAMDDDFHWDTLIEMVDELERRTGAELSATPIPDYPDMKYLNQRIARLTELSAEPRRQT